MVTGDDNNALRCKHDNGFRGTFVCLLCGVSDPPEAYPFPKPCPGEAQPIPLEDDLLELVSSWERLYPTRARLFVDEVRALLLRRAPREAAEARPDVTPDSLNVFAGVNPKSPESHLRSVLWEILGGMGAESVESAAQRVVNERSVARIERDTEREKARLGWIEVARRNDTITDLRRERANPNGTEDSAGSGPAPQAHRDGGRSGRAGGGDAPDANEARAGTVERAAVATDNASVASAIVVAARLSEDRKGGDPSEWPEELRVQEFPRPTEARKEST